METEDNYYNLSAINPTLKCEQVNDRFTKIGSTIATIDNQGTNQKLSYPIGLLTVDETIFAGGTLRSNTNYYLYTNSWYWTMSPSRFLDDGARAVGVSLGGHAPDSDNVGFGNAVFPAISLSSTAITGGLGTAISPFTVSP